MKLFQIFKEAIQCKDYTAYENFLLSLYERSIRNPTLKSKPYLMWLDPVGSCNLQCPFCPTGTGELQRKKTKLSLNDFKHIVDHIGQYLFVLKFYNWSEPLLSDDLEEMIKYAKKFHMFTEISTNLSIPITQTRAEQIIDSGIDFILCSIDGGSQETYEKYRKGGNYKLCMKNLEILSNIKNNTNKHTPKILWQFFVFKHNQHEIEFAKKQASEIGVDIDFRIPSIPLSSQDWVSTLPEFANKSDMLIQSDMDYSKKNSDPCTWLWSSIVINADKNISPCCILTNKKDDFGNVDESIDKVWNNNNYQNARKLFSNENILDKTFCQQCNDIKLQQRLFSIDKQIFTHLLQKSSPQQRIKIKSQVLEFGNNIYSKLVD